MQWGSKQWKCSRTRRLKKLAESRVPAWTRTCWMDFTRNRQKQRDKAQSPTVNVQPLRLETGPGTESMWWLWRLKKSSTDSHMVRWTERFRWFTVTSSPEVTPYCLPINTPAIIIKRFPLPVLCFFFLTKKLNSSWDPGIQEIQ